MKYLTLVILIAGQFSTAVFLHAGVSGKTVHDTVVTPGEHYGGGAVYRFFFGSGHRDIWTTPVRLPVLDLQTHAGGLKPVRRGGGMQTNSLRFVTPEGVEYAFRSLDKFPGRALPEDMQGTFIESWTKDQVASMMPFNALIAQYLADQAGVMQSPSYYCIMPDDPALGEFRSEFAGMPGALERRPDEGIDDTPGFAGSEKIISTSKFSERLDDTPKNRLDRENYLTARLLDLLIGDWDRHGDQWRWARFEEDGMNVWRPVARDRDWSFVIYDGLFPRIMDQRWAYTNLDSYHKKKPDIHSLAHNARHLDSRMLSGLAWNEWQVVIDSFLEKMTDEVLETAVRQLPPEVYSVTGGKITTLLKYRRDYLKELARDFYLYHSAAISIQTTDKDEVVTLSFRDSGLVDVRIARSKTPDLPYYRRRCKPDETGEIRIHLLGGDDEISVTGIAESSVIIRIIGGKGDDRIVKPSDKNRIYVYDTKNGMDVQAARNVTFTASTKSVAHKRPPVGYPESRFLKEMKGERLPPPYDHGYTWSPRHYFGFDRDNGLFIGGGVRITRWGFRADPCVTQHTVLANFAARTGALQLKYEGDYYRVIPGAKMVLNLEAAVPENKPNFFGFGNESDWDEEKEENDFYQTPQKYLRVENRAEVSAGRANGWFGIAWQYLDTDLSVSRDRRIFELREQVYGIEVEHTLCLVAGFRIDTRDSKIAPEEGFLLRSNFEHFPGVLDNQSDYTRMNVGLNGYYTFSDRITLAGRALYRNVTGMFPYYHAAYIGGNETLRGFSFQRFAGDRSMNGGLDFRFLLDRINFILPSDIGIILFSDAGRVWMNEKSPGNWHIGYGLGAYIAPLMRNFTMSLSAAASEESVFLFGNFGFTF